MSKEHPDSWKYGIRKKLNDMGYRFNVERDWDGKVKKIDSDPLSDYEYNPEFNEWFPTEEGSEKDNNFSLEGDKILSHCGSFGAKLSEEESTRWLEEWLKASKEVYREQFNSET
ncbi:MAG: hypothetical protein FVQ79_13620 [Planctomycetes bacterium]|nr:hypothetical protein [Planctomycetota bacterium]